jgi:hypothetical protein
VLAAARGEDALGRCGRRLLGRGGLVGGRSHLRGGRGGLGHRLGRRSDRFRGRLGRDRLGRDGLLGGGGLAAIDLGLGRNLGGGRDRSRLDHLGGGLGYDLGRLGVGDRSSRLLGRLLGGLLGRLGLLGGDVTNETLPLGLAADAVRLGLDHAGGVALDADTERIAEIEALLVGQPELTCELVHPDV